MNTTQKTTKDGFTLFEILIAIAIIGGLIALFYPMIQRYRTRANIQTAQLKLGQIKQAVDLFKMDIGEYPSNLQDLVRKPTVPQLAQKWVSSYIDSTLIEDPAIRYRKTPGGKNPYELTYTLEEAEAPLSVWKK